MRDKELHDEVKADYTAMMYAENAEEVLDQLDPLGGISHGPAQLFAAVGAVGEDRLQEGKEAARRVMGALQRAVPIPQHEIIVHRELRRQVFRQGAPLAAGLWP